MQMQVAVLELTHKQARLFEERLQILQRQSQSAPESE